MNLLSKLFLFSTMLIGFSTFSNAQIFQFGAGGGLTQILAPERYTNSIADGGLGFSTEWNAGAIIKLGLPLIPITPRAYFLYHSLSGTGELDPAYYQNTNIEVTQSISEIGVGAQYNFIPLPAGIDPYIALDIACNIFSPIKEGDDYEVPNSDGTRFGGGIGVGTEITIIPIIDIDVYATYKMFNLIGKEDGEENVTAFVLDAFITLSFL